MEIVRSYLRNEDRINYWGPRVACCALQVSALGIYFYYEIWVNIYTVGVTHSDVIN